MDVDVVDEHFYMEPDWFFENADRYDSFDRDGPIIFPGEYAAHGPEGEYGSSRNTWLSALAEAAFMTGFERNADIVHMCAYAPLLAHIDAWQWRPDLIWFDNLNVFGSPNYYVHKLYSNHAGTHVVPTLMNDKVIIGQDKLYASTTIDTNKDQAYIKMVNASNDTTTVTIQLKVKPSIKNKAKVYVMQSDDLISYNSIQEPLKIAPAEVEINNVGKRFEYQLLPQSFQVIVLNLD
jgi:alpha-N-arabinofuranosidase